ncbi:B4GALNT2 [Branchiostoma lanceolatum]|uniref:B4GALNT2 protein n=1 Tax=Branchiostoma lanceolatum TaxID=7740 RepID=A0A8K0EJ59_BRALA|nr:B4GALNT2 [Branchiostoma lanceolatum]
MTDTKTSVSTQEDLNFEMAASRKLVVGAALAVCLLATSLTGIVRYKYLRKEGYKEHCANRYSSAIFHHLKHNQGHSFNLESTDILDREPRWFERGVREAIYERIYNPTLNRKGGLRVELLDNQIVDTRCDCTGKALVFADAIPKHEKEDVLKRKKIELLKYRKRTESTRETLLFANGSVPLSYPTQGVTVVPEGVIEIPGLEVVDNSKNKEYQVQLNTSHYGVLDVTETLSEVQVDGRRTTCLVMRSSSLVVLNRQLRIVVYVNTVYDIDARDLDNDINNKVTIITKTFLRYPSVKALLNSIRMFYPKIRIVVADDSRPVEDLQAENIDHYVMPFGAGWFGGRNLALSQVTTPYFLWVDDDYVFVNDTKLEKFVEVLDNTNMDLVSGRVGNKILMYSKLSIIPGGDHGDCLFQDHEHFGRVPGYPHCYLTPKVTNFFMGRTDEVRAVGFDPTYSRFGHTVEECAFRG